MIRLRKTLTVALVVVMAFLFVAAPVSAKPSDHPGAVRFHVSIEWIVPGPEYWWGGVSGGMTGMVKYLSDPNGNPRGSGIIGHFYEVFTICIGKPVVAYGCDNPEEGSYITGVDTGVYDVKPDAGKWHFMANGWVTGASPDYAYMIGYKYFENGWTTDPYDPVLTTGEAEAFLAPA